MRLYKYRSDATFRPSFGGFSLMPPVIKFMLIANLGIFAMMLLVGNVRFAGSSLNDWLYRTQYLWPLGSGLFRPWQMISYMFLHEGFWHVGMNMLILWMFGVELEQVMGSRRFGVYYFLCGLGGALGQLFIAPFFSDPAPTIGASGAIFGVMLAFGLMFPDRLIYIYFFFPIKAKYAVLLFVAYEIFQVGGPGNVAHLAHLGGASIGLLYLLVEDRIPIDAIFDAIGGMFKRDTRMTYRPGGKSVEAKYTDLPDNQDQVTQEMIDQILDKISKTGYQNLTEREKQILFEASKKIH